jgi:hypothetical protein
VQGNDCPGSIKLGLTKNKGENGNKQIHLGNPQYSERVRRGGIDYLEKEERGIILIPRSIIRGHQMDGEFTDFGFHLEDTSDGLVKKFQAGKVAQTYRCKVNVRHGN